MQNQTPNPVAVWQCDVLVAGSGAGGLAAAVTAAHHGLKVIVAERAATCGGATARSGGWAWTPGNPLAKADGVNEPRDDFRAYLQAVIGAQNYDAERVEMFLENAPHMVGFFEKLTPLKFTPGTKICDIYGNLPGAGTGHRSVAATPFYAKSLPQHLLNILPDQYKMTAFWGMGIMAGSDLGHFLNAMKKPQSFAYAARRFAIHVWDKIVYKRNMQMVNGLALIARLVQAADEKGVRIEVNTAVKALIEDEHGKTVGAYLDTPQGVVRVEAAKGVILATGGYPANTERRKNFPRNPDGRQHWTLVPDEADGAGLALAESAGGYLDERGRSPAAWCPVSVVKFKDGSEGVFPHIADRAKPGIIGVLKNGKRFVNEANGYYDYVTGMLQAVPEGEAVESWLIGDKRAVRSYMFGFAKPRPIPLAIYTKYLHCIEEADTLDELAEKCGIDSVGLMTTVAEFNRMAKQGKDTDFGRGDTPFNRYGGDASTGYPNPSLAPLGKGPYYAVKVQVGSFGTFAGIAVDAFSRVLRQDGSVSDGLYAVGLDQKSVFGGNYPCGGINIGPALTFGYAAARHIAGVTRYEDDGSVSPSAEYLGKLWQPLSDMAKAV
ncbi:FAD-dependent oxidoreductase [Neisseria perflava]|uniref:FAD-dependent oxidoreductase n=1 Tax=Neisseria perflava TaxID=33053 RepID=UPI0020A15974|nr:FAD-dependent oxidoreductase [Neisseria perflava]MCP1660441.1 succinate dehydrogenase/fumarate reductase flavoprotein subunit [Neisseria perflava]MCP1772123.1 succinate dehydrogenase/fumarate reductase flavoprotein subunit [Neisseria perflava]